MMGLSYHQIEPGMKLELGSYLFTREAMLAFAQKYDPQPFHVNDEAAARGPFGKLAASGWHTSAIFMKLFVAANQKAEAGLRADGKKPVAVGPSPGFNNLKWIKPVLAGDTLSYTGVITGKRELASRPEWGIVFSLNEAHNQRGDLVFSFEGKVLVARL